MFCPSCGAEYRSGFATCSDCNVALVAELPQQAMGEGGDPQSEAVLVWSGSDANRHGQASATLTRAGLNPHDVSHEDQVFGTTERAQFEIFVAPQFAEKAKAVLEESTFSDEEWTELEQSGGFELPAEDAPDDEPIHRDLNDWNSEDATAEIWSGEDTDLADMIVASLNENQIDCRSESVSAGAAGAQHGASAQRLLVHPEDEVRGKEIVREIVNAMPS